MNYVHLSCVYEKSTTTYRKKFYYVHRLNVVCVTSFAISTKHLDRDKVEIHLLVS